MQLPILFMKLEDMLVQSSEGIFSHIPGTICPLYRWKKASEQMKNNRTEEF